jgi:tryptophan 2,3-dioxygenase
LKNLSENDERLKAIFDEGFHKEQMEQGKRTLSFKVTQYTSLGITHKQATQAAMLIMAYSDEPLLYMPSTLLSLLIDIDENLSLWRYRHALVFIGD